MREKLLVLVTLCSSTKPPPRFMTVNNLGMSWIEGIYHYQVQLKRFFFDNSTLLLPTVYCLDTCLFEMLNSINT